MPRATLRLIKMPFKCARNQLGFYLLSLFSCRCPPSSWLLITKSQICGKLWQTSWGKIHGGGGKGKAAHRKENA